MKLLSVRALLFSLNAWSAKFAHERPAKTEGIERREERKALMKMMKLVVLIVMIALALFLVIPNLAWAGDDGAGMYKAKCAACHGADGAGKPAAKIPSLISEDAKKASDADLTDMVANGGKDKKATHAYSAKGLTPDQIKMVVAYVRDLQKK
jgi:cytochrome c6